MFFKILWHVIECDPEPLGFIFALSPFPWSVLKPYFCITSFLSGRFLRSFCTQILASLVQPFCCYSTALDIDQYCTIMQGGAHYRWSRYVGWECGAHITDLRQQCHNSKLVIFREKLLKVLKCLNFLWVQRRHNCSPASSFMSCVMTLYLLKVHLQTFLSIPITQKCQILSCDTLVTNEQYVINTVSNCHNRLAPFFPHYHQKNGRVTFFKILWHVKPEMNHVQDSVEVSTKWYANCENIDVLQVMCSVMVEGWTTHRGIADRSGQQFSSNLLEAAVTSYGSILWGTDIHLYCPLQMAQLSGRGYFIL
jgi:hypothetical protein